MVHIWQSLLKAAIGVMEMKKPPSQEAFLKQNNDLVLKLPNILRSRTFLALDNIETDPFAFCQGFEAFSLNRRMMDKKILTTFLLDKTKPL
jgi:hypothetical protein